MGALHCLSPRRSSERYQCNFSGALGADVGNASHRPSQQLISRGRSPNETFFLKRTMDVHWSASCQALAAAPPPSRGVQAFETEPHGRAAGEVQRLRASRKWRLHASDVLIRFVVNVS